MAKKAKNGRIAVVTVHGTNDTASGPDGDKWFQNGSAFAARLCAHLSAAGIQADIVPHLWSGANSALAREEGALKLTQKITRLTQNYEGVHIVGHSHGGNVSADGVRGVAVARSMRRGLFGWAIRFEDGLHSVTTVGTPFLRPHITTMQMVAAYFFVAIIFISGQVLVSHVENGAAGIFTDVRGEITRALKAPREALAFVGAFVAIFFVLPLAGRGMWRVIAGRMRRSDKVRIFSIWHANDEAIAFLQKVETAQIEPFLRGALWRGSRTFGIVAGVWTVFIALALSVLGYGLLALGVDFPRWIDGLLGYTANYTIDTPTGPVAVDSLYGNVLIDQALAFFPRLLLYSPLIFAAGYAVARLIFGFVFEYGLRGWFNGLIGGSLRGMALGRDGDSRIGDVAAQSHAFATKVHVLDGDVAARMQAGATVAANRLLDKYRWALFSVGSESSGAINDLAVDAMTWSSLIHTTYFDQPEVAALIADHIVAETRAASAEKR